MIYYYDSLEKIERLRIMLSSQDYDYISSQLEYKKSLYNISDFDNWHTWALNNIGVDNSVYNAQVYIQEQYIYALFRAKDTIDKINSGVPISSLLLTNILSTEYIPYSQFADSWWVEMAEIECPLFAIEDIGTEYDLKILFWIINGINTAYHLPIVDKIIWELQLSQGSQHKAINHDCTLEYLLKYRELLKSNSVPTLTNQQQQQIYSIPTDLSEQQLKALLERLQSNGFVASEQTEEDFLNSFEIEGRKPTKQGKIKWIKRSEDRTDLPNVCNTVIVDFIYKITCDSIKGVDLMRKAEVIFGVTINKSTVSQVKKRKAKKASEYSEVLADIFAEIANL